MKYLSDYMEQPQTKLFEETGTFFAFSNEQFDEQAKKGVKYVGMGGGMVTPEEHVKDVINRMYDIYKTCIEIDIKENGIDKIILRELQNHECFYTGDITDCIEKLKDYPSITETKILTIYRKNYAKYA